MGEATFAQAPRCQGVVRAGVGYNNVDLAAAGRHGVVVCNVPDYGTEEVADHAIMFLLAVARHLIPSDAAIRAGELGLPDRPSAPPGSGARRSAWSAAAGSARPPPCGPRRSGSTWSSTTRYVPAGTRQGAGHPPRSTGSKTLLEQSHFVSLHCYLDETTHHLIDAEALARMRPGSILINTARGPVVDQAALLEALDSGHLAGAGLDVVEREPLDDDRLRHHPRVILTPHSAFYSVEGFVELRTKAAEEVRRVLLGEPPRNLVNGRLGTPDPLPDDPLDVAGIGEFERISRIRANNSCGYAV